MDWPMTPVPTQPMRVVSGEIGRSETLLAVSDDDMAAVAAAVASWVAVGVRVFAGSALQGANERSMALGRLYVWW